MSFVGAARRVLTRELSLLREFVTTPKGVFETVDEAVRIVRQELALPSRLMRARILRR
jgi:hypothetical protein